jgi:hypothetical protein
MKKTINIVEVQRQTGNTYWLLKSAISEPKCILIFKNRSIAIDNEKVFINMGGELFNDFPKFVGLEEYRPTRKYKAPIMFDNSCFSSSDGVLFKTSVTNQVYNI